MKKIMLLGLLVVLSAILLTGCSDDDDNSTEPEIVYAYSLDQFVTDDALGAMIAHDDDDDENWNELFYFWPVADDDFSPRVRGYDDLCWGDWEQGYYIPADDNKVYFPQYAAQGIGAYNVKYMENVYVYRGIKSVITDTMSVLYELNAMTTQQVENYDAEMEAAIPLADFIPPHFTQVDSVSFVAVDGWEMTYSTDEINDGYWLTETQKTIFPGFPNMSGSKKKFKWLKEINVFGTWQNVDDFINEALADENSSDLNFSFPEDLTDYVGEVWE